VWGNDNVRGIALAFFLAVAIKTKSVRTDFFVVAKVRRFLGIAKNNYKCMTYNFIFKKR
jgi:hypothetical protein